MNPSENPVPSFIISVLELPNDLPPNYLSKGIYSKAIHSFKIIHRGFETEIIKVFW